MLKLILKKSLRTAVLATAGLAMMASSASAQITYVQGHFLLGFRASGGQGSGSNILVDLGPGSGFLTSSTPFTFSLGNLGSVLSTTYGANWFNRGDVFWSVAGAGVSPDPTNTLYLTAPGSVAGFDATPWQRLGNANQQNVRLKINNEGTQYNSYTQTAGNPAVIEGQLDTNSYGSYHPGGTAANSGPAPGISYSFYNPTIEGTFVDGTAGITLDLFRLAPNATPGTPGEYVGEFTITDAGLVTFTPVPEPSTFATLALGAGLLLFVLRRRKTASA